jgi:serine/threonine-protein kinase PknG
MTDRCQRPGCSGTYAADGYCDECGHKAPAASGSGSGSGGSGGKAGRPSTSVSRDVWTELGLTTQATTSSTPTTGRTTRGRTGRTSRGGLGANLVDIAPVPLRDATSAVLADPQVPEAQRFCGTCGEPVGRSKQGRPGRVDGFCPKDGAPFFFRPRLAPGELVDGRYEILGALAHGGLGWIYLARDRNISGSGADRWVVLKGLINTGDPDAMAAAVAERRFLVEVDHPNIVKIHDFAQHPDATTGETIGYIVMEYVGGRSLKDLAFGAGAGGRRGPLPLEQVLAYGIEILPALGYLHQRGLLFCDFKPDNVIHAEEQLKLIDLGAVRHVDDQASALWSTPGYQAPELADEGASVASDLYTVGRTLAVLSFDFGGFSTRYADRLPDPGDVDLLAREESYHRLLSRATHRDPGRRFSTAAEFAEQALGVLREVLAAKDGTPRPAPSTQFTAERRAAATDHLDGYAAAQALPLPLVDPTDPAAGFLATLDGSDVDGTIAALRQAPVPTIEVSLRLIRALVEAKDQAGAAAELAALTADPGDWRPIWYAGLAALAADDGARAATAFNLVYDLLPGEPAAKLALAMAGELSGDRDGAARRYARVWRADRGFVSAAFGLARILLATGDRAGTVAILAEVPESSSHYLAAQMAAVGATVDGRAGQVGEAELTQASDRLERLRLDPQRRALLTVEVLRAALDLLSAKGRTPVPSASALLRQALARRSTGTASAGPTGTRSPAGTRAPAASGLVLGHALRDEDVRRGLEQAYRTLASLEADPRQRYALVDQANAVRPYTVV